MNERSAQAPAGRLRPLRGARILLASGLAASLSLAGCATTPPSPSAPTATAPAASGVTTATTATVSAPTTPPATNAAQCPAAPDAFVKRAPGDGKTVALTFDDGPAPADAEIVEILGRYHVSATFFVTGKNAEASPDVVRTISEAGHLLADHSFEHQYPSAVSGGWSVSYLTSEMKKTNAAISASTRLPVCFYRPPGGYTNNVLAAASKQRLTSVMWSVDSLDWKQPSTTTAAATAAIVAAATEADGQQHPIVLMHSGKASHEPDASVSPNRSNTVAALPEIIEWYQTNGYAFVRLDGKQ
jgi:peptidoglycan/xylan/chitin deacetylase (PgdA/CDA1 family)